MLTPSSTALLAALFGAEPELCTAPPAPPPQGRGVASAAPWAGDHI